jgi:hypothetical protein
MALACSTACPNPWRSRRAGFAISRSAPAPQQPPDVVEHRALDSGKQTRWSTHHRDAPRGGAVRGPTMLGCGYGVLGVTLQDNGASPGSNR